MEPYKSAFGIFGLVLIAVGFLKEESLLKLNWVGSTLMTIYAIFIGDPIFILLQVVIVAVLTYRIIKEWKLKVKKDVST